jgi:hypothetical protein
MKFIKLDLLTLLISLFLFASCEKSSTIGLEIDPTSAVQGDLIDTVTVSSRTVADDVTQTGSLTRHPFGYLKDPVFGATEAELALTLKVPSANFNFGSAPILDSAVLVLNYGGEFYGDSTSNYSIDVYQLAENISEQTSFPSNKSWTKFGMLLGNKSGKIFPATSLKVIDLVTNKPDTLKTVTPQVRIKLDNNFITDNILNINAENLKSDGTFARLFSGLHLSINKTNSTGTGGLMFFEFTGSTSGLYLYYKKQSTTVNTSRDTVLVNFPIISAPATPVAATIKHDYTGTAIATQLSTPNQQYATTYLQPLVGLRNKISFPYLNKLIANTGKIVVNKAELVIDLSTGTDTNPFSAAPRLSLYRFDIAERRQNLPDNVNLDPTVFGGYFDAVKKQYVFVVTSYIQGLLSGSVKDYGTFLAPTPTNEFQYLTPSLSSGARSVIGSFKKNPSISDKTMKLNIYYTKIN